jgi:hypothetical protein
MDLPVFQTNERRSFWWNLIQMATQMGHVFHIQRSDA